jgi:GNAT superfamily N-acetyltransferase
VDGAAAGFTLLPQHSTFLRQPGIFLEDLFVRPELRARGVGRALLARLASLAKDRGCGRLEWAVLDWNADAIGFYRRIGATAMTDWTTYRLAGEALARLAVTGRD